MALKRSVDQITNKKKHEASKERFEVEESGKFYDELDSHRVHKSCCSLNSMIFLAVIIFVLLASGFYFVYSKIKNQSIGLSKITNNFSWDNFQKKFDNLVPTGDGRYSLVLGEDDLSGLFYGGLSAESFLLKDIQAIIDPTKVLIYGNLTKPLNSKVIITALPKVIDGKVQFEVNNTLAGSLNLPAFLNSQIATTLSDNLNDKISLIYQKITVEEIQLKESKMIITGKKNE